MGNGKRKSKREAIIDSAVWLIAHEGMQAATIRAITHRVGITEGALYRHFKSKAELLQEIYEQLVARMAEAKSAIAASDLPFADKLKSWVRITYEFYDEYPEAFTFVLLTPHNLDNDIFHRQGRVFSGMFESAREAGIAREIENPLALSHFTGVILNVPRMINEGKPPRSRQPLRRGCCGRGAEAVDRRVVSQARCGGSHIPDGFQSEAGSCDPFTGSGAENRAFAMRSTFSSSRNRPVICRPYGRPLSSKPQGTDAAGSPRVRPRQIHRSIPGGIDAFGCGAGRRRRDPCVQRLAIHSILKVLPAHGLVSADRPQLVVRDVRAGFEILAGHGFVEIAVLRPPMLVNPSSLPRRSIASDHD